MIAACGEQKAGGTVGGCGYEIVEHMDGSWHGMCCLHAGACWMRGPPVLVNIF